MPSAEFALDIPIPTNGIQAHLPPTQVGFSGLVNAENWIYRSGVFSTRPGLADFGTDCNERPMGFIQYNHGSETNRIVMGTYVADSHGKWRHYNVGSGAWDDITGGTHLAGGTTALQVFRTFEKGGVVYILGCNGVAHPKKWSGSGSYANIANVPSAVQSAKCMAIAGDRLLLSQGQNIYASNNLDFDAWTEGYYVILADTPGDIVAMQEFGNQRVAVYKENCVYAGLAQVDLTKKFRWELVRTGIPGPVSPLAVYMIGTSGVQAYLALSGDVMLFNGSSVESMGEHIRSYVQATMDYNSRGRAFGFYEPSNSECWFFYTSQGASDVNTAIVIDAETRAFHAFKFNNHKITAGLPMIITSSILVGSLPIIDTIDITFAEMDSGQRGVMLGESGGQVYHHYGTTDDGSAITAWFETGMQTGPDPRRFNVLHSAEHIFPTSANSQNVSIYLGASDYGENPSYTAAQTIDAGATARKETQHRLPGRYFSLKMMASASQLIRWYGSRATMTPTGLR